MTAQICNNLCSHDSQKGNGSGMCKHTKAVVWIEKHGLRWCQSTVTTSRARARDVPVDSRRASDECQDIHMIVQLLSIIYHLSLTCVNGISRPCGCEA